MHRSNGYTSHVRRGQFVRAPLCLYSWRPTVRSAEVHPSVPLDCSTNAGVDTAENDVKHSRLDFPWRDTEERAVAYPEGSRVENENSIVQQVSALEEFPFELLMERHVEEGSGAVLHSLCMGALQLLHKGFDSPRG